MPVISESIKKSKANKNKKSVLRLLLSFDDSIKTTYNHLDELVIIGVDEVGIGCLAGPVVAAATILPVMPPRSNLAKNLSALNDSKKVDAKTREQLAHFIQQHAHYSIASASVQEIDELNILQAGLLAMKRAVTDLMDKLFHRSHNVVVLIDGNKKIPQLEHEQMCIIKGDSQSASIAAASVIAKVFRDQFMQELALQYPHYSWHSNKGYGSAAHRQAISEHGLCSWHRKAFTSAFASDVEDFLAEEILEEDYG